MSWDEPEITLLEYSKVRLVGMRRSSRTGAEPRQRTTNYFTGKCGLERSFPSRENITV